MKIFSDCFSEKSGMKKDELYSLWIGVLKLIIEELETATSGNNTYISKLRKTLAVRCQRLIEFKQFIIFFPIYCNFILIIDVKVIIFFLSNVVCLMMNIVNVIIVIFIIKILRTKFD